MSAFKILPIPEGEPVDIPEDHEVEVVCQAESGQVELHAKGRYYNEIDIPKLTVKLGQDCMGYISSEKAIPLAGGRNLLFAKRPDISTISYSRVKDIHTSPQPIAKVIWENPRKE